MTRRALITGGAGFIGSHIARALLERGDSVRILDDLSTGRMENLRDVVDDVELLRADIRNEDALGQAVKDVDTVYHLAAEISVPRSIEAPVRTYEVNALGTLRLLQACVSASVQSVVLSSSCAVYGDAEALPKTEAMLPEPLSPYASSKVTGEHLMTMYARLHGIHAVSLRYFNVFGPRQDPGSEYAAVIPKFIQRMLRGRRPVIFGDGSQTRDFVYVQNVVRANLAAADANGASGGVFNVGSGIPTSIRDLVGKLGRILEADVAPEHGPARKGDILHSHGDISLARSELGFQPEVDLQEGLTRTVEWFRSQPDGEGP